MKTLFGLFLGAVLALGMAAPSPAEAGKKGVRGAETGGYFGHRSSRRYRRPQVRGYVARRGGYSYKPQDTINTYGDSRTQFGGINVYRQFSLDRQTPSGPFDNGFFFDSGMGRNGGNSPYLN